MRVTLSGAEVESASRREVARASADVLRDNHTPGWFWSKSVTPPEAGMATRDKPAAAASSRALGIPSCREESTKTGEPAKNFAGRSIWPVKRTASFSPSSALRSLRAASSLPSPTIVKSAVGNSVRTWSQRLDQEIKSLFSRQPAHRQKIWGRVRPGFRFFPVLRCFQVFRPLLRSSTNFSEIDRVGQHGQSSPAGLR